MLVTPMFQNPKTHTFILKQYEAILIKLPVHAEGCCNHCGKAKHLTWKVFEMDFKKPIKLNKSTCL